MANHSSQIVYKSYPKVTVAPSVLRAPQRPQDSPTEAFSRAKRATRTPISAEQGYQNKDQQTPNETDSNEGNGRSGQSDIPQTGPISVWRMFKRHLYLPASKPETHKPSMILPALLISSAINIADQSDDDTELKRERAEIRESNRDLLDFLDQKREKKRLTRALHRSRLEKWMAQDRFADSLEDRTRYDGPDPDEDISGLFYSDSDYGDDSDYGGYDDFVPIASVWIRISPSGQVETNLEWNLEELREALQLVEYGDQQGVLDWVGRDLEVKGRMLRKQRRASV